MTRLSLYLILGGINREQINKAIKPIKGVKTADTKNHNKNERPWLLA